MIGPARLSCRSGVGRSGASRSGALLTVFDEVGDYRSNDSGVQQPTGFVLGPADGSLRKGNTTGEGPDDDWTVA